MNQKRMLSKECATLPAETLYPIIKSIILKGESIIIVVTGNSMFPFLIHNRDKVTLVPCNPPYLKRGDIVLYQRDNGNCVLHRIYQVKDNSFTIIGDAQWSLEFGIRAEQICARVVKATRKNKEVSCEGGIWHTLMKLYLYRMKAPRLCHFMFKSIVLYPRAICRRIKKYIIRPVNP